MERKRINMLLCEFKDIHTSYISNINMSKILSRAIKMMMESSVIDFYFQILPAHSDLLLLSVNKICLKGCIGLAS